MYSSFIHGFAEATDSTCASAQDSWFIFAAGLSEDTRRSSERGGYRRGKIEGKKFLREQDSSAKVLPQTATYLEMPEFPGYFVGDDGSVWSSLEHHGWQPRIAGCRYKRLKPDICDGYPRVMLYRKGKRVRRFVHVLVLNLFRGPCPEGKEACHNDGDRANPRLENLRWDTPENNHADRARHGTKHYGERSPRAKLTNEQVVHIKKLIAEGVMRKLIAKTENVSISTVNAIATGQTWAWMNEVHQ